MGLNAQERLAKSHEASNVENGIWCELVKLHTINKEEPMEKLVGRKRKAAEEESKKHYPITTRGLWDPLSAWKFYGILGAMRPSALAFSTSFFVMVERTQLWRKRSWPWCSWWPGVSRASNMRSACELCARDGGR
jgi:hypothetical protein